MADTLVKTSAAGATYRFASDYPELKNYLMSVESQQYSGQGIDLYNAQFYDREDGNMYGPLSLWELPILNIDENSELSIDEMQHWTTAKDFVGLLETIRQISGEDEQAQIYAEREQIILDKDELEHIIKEQEKDLINKQTEIDNKDQELANQQKELADSQREVAEKQKEIDSLKRQKAEKEQNIQKQQMEIELMQSQPKIIELQWAERPTFDLTSDYKKRYYSFEEKRGSRDFLCQSELNLV